MLFSTKNNYQLLIYTIIIPIFLFQIFQTFLILKVLH